MSYRIEYTRMKEGLIEYRRYLKIVMKVTRIAMLHQNTTALKRQEIDTRSGLVITTKIINGKLPFS